MQRYPWQSLVEKSCIVTSLALTSVTLLPSHQVLAQVTPDGTLGTLVNDGNGSISGGTQRGTALFHSFSSFSIPAGQTFTFQDQGVVTIFSRVTGSSRSFINGILAVSGTADLFLLNPNGILFGPNSALDINGSFVATTARSIVFSDGGEFSAVNPSAVLPVTVTASTPIGLRFGDFGVSENVNRDNLRPIDNQGNLRANENLALVSHNRIFTDQGNLSAGENLTLVGGPLSGTGQLSGSEVTLVGAHPTDAVSFVNMSLDGTFIEISDNPSFSRGINAISTPETGSSPRWSDLRPTNPSEDTLSISANNVIILGDNDGGTVEILADTLNIYANEDLEITGSLIQAEPRQNQSPTILHAGNNIILSDSTLAGSVGDPIRVESGSQIVINNSLVNIFSTSSQRALNFSIQSTGETALVNSRIQSSNSNTGSGGSIDLSVGSLRVIDYRLGTNSIFSFAPGPGDGGAINIRSRGPISFEGPGATIRSQASSGSTGSVSIVSENGDISFNSNFISPRGLRGLPGIYTSTGSSNRDDISTGSVSIIARNGNVNFQNNVQVRTDAGGTRNAGNISLQADNGQVNLINGANLVANTFGRGNGGRINIVAEDGIFINRSVISSRSLLDRDQPSDVLGNGGDISLQADQISVENAQIVATTQLQGNGGTIRLNSPGNITLSNGASLNAGTFGSGVGGNISVNVPSDLLSGATLTTPGVRPTGQNVTLSGGSTINAGTSGTGLGGNVQVGVGGILRVDNSTVTVSSTGSPINGTPPGNAGTLRTNSRYVQLDNGQLAATSFASNGGNIDMAVDNILLLRNRGLISTQSDGPESRDGNIAIRAGGIVAIPQENSDIIARSSRQGNVKIETQAIIGIAINQGMDEIPTISEVLSTGDTVLNLGIDPSQGTQELDQEPRDVELAQGCDASSGEDEARYVDIGQGGQAAGPDDSLSSGTLETDWVDLESAGTPSNRPTPPAAQQAAQSAQPAPTCP